MPQVTLSVLRAHAGFITGEVGEQGSLQVCCDLREEGGRGTALTVSTVGLLSPARSLEGQPGLWIFNSTNPPGAPDGVTGRLVRGMVVGTDAPQGAYSQGVIVSECLGWAFTHQQGVPGGLPHS